MGKLGNFKKISYNNKDYAVTQLNYNGNNVPVILDWDIRNKIIDFDKNWRINEKGYVVTSHKIIQEGGNESSRDIYLHDVVLKLKGLIPNKPVLHINKLGIDNRFDNLMLDTRNKEITKNLNKKTRTVILPKNSKININDIPSYVWYMKPDSSHGDRFLVDIDNIKWKTSSSKDLSLKYKLEEAKKFLRELKISKEHLFNDYSMNGDLNEHGKDNLTSFVTISQSAGFKNLNNNIENNTDIYLKEDLKGLSEFEINLLTNFIPRF